MRFIRFLSVAPCWRLSSGDGCRRLIGSSRLSAASMVRSDGTIVWTFSSCVLLRDTNGNRKLRTSCPGAGSEKMLQRLFLLTITTGGWRRMSSDVVGCRRFSLKDRTACLKHGLLFLRQVFVSGRRHVTPCRHGGQRSRLLYFSVSFTGLFLRCCVGLRRDRRSRPSIFPRLPARRRQTARVSQSLGGEDGAQVPPPANNAACL